MVACPAPCTRIKNMSATCTPDINSQETQAFSPAGWDALVRHLCTLPRRIRVVFAASFAITPLSNFERRYPEDGRLRAVVDATVAWAITPSKPLRVIASTTAADFRPFAAGDADAYAACCVAAAIPAGSVASASWAGGLGNVSARWAELLAIYRAARGPLGITFDPLWLTDTVRAIVKGIYDARDTSAAPILADALQDAGCECTEVLHRLRTEGATLLSDWILTQVWGMWEDGAK